MGRGCEKCSDLERLDAAGETAAAPAALALVGEGGRQGEKEGKDGGNAKHESECDVRKNTK